MIVAGSPLITDVLEAGRLAYEDEVAAKALEAEEFEKERQRIKRIQADEVLEALHIDESVTTYDEKRGGMIVQDRLILLPTTDRFYGVALAQALCSVPDCHEYVWSSRPSYTSIHNLADIGMMFSILEGSPQFCQLHRELMHRGERALS